MKVLAKILTVVTLLAVILYGYVIWTSNAVINYIGCTASQGDMAERIKTDINRGADTFVMYADSFDEDATLVTYGVRIGNYDVVPFECVGIELETKDGDVLLYSADLIDVEPFSQALEQITLATTANDLTRHAQLSYYIHGHYKEFEVELVNE